MAFHLDLMPSHRNFHVLARQDHLWKIVNDLANQYHIEALDNPIGGPALMYV